MDVELSYTTKDCQPRRHAEMWTRSKTSVKMHEVLAHYIVEDEYALQPIHIDEDPMENIIHISLPEQGVSIGLVKCGGTRRNVPFSFLEIDTCMGCEESMP